LETIQDFEDLLDLLCQHRVRYLIVGGMAFIYHAKPRFTKDIDLWVAPDPENVASANHALAAFGSPHLLDPANPEEILQIGVAPNRVAVLRDVGLGFDEAWDRRVESEYGRAQALWIGLDDLIAVKSQIDSPRHQEDARVLRLVRDRRDGHRTP
jgi:hypothetical protein